MGDVQGYITSGPPLRVKVDGALTACPALVLDGATYSVGARVTITVRNPTPPLIKGTES